MNPLPAQVNVRATVLFDHSKRAITSGTISYYMKATTGDNAGKWYKSDNTWAATETAYGTATHEGSGAWSRSVRAEGWVDGTEYLEYWLDSVGRNQPEMLSIRADTGVTVDEAGMANNIAGILLDSGVGGNTPEDLQAASEAALAAYSAPTHQQVIDAVDSGTGGITDTLNTGVNLLGSAKVGPAAKSQWALIKDYAFLHGTTALVARVKGWDGTDLTPADVDAVSYSVYTMDARGNERDEVVVGYSDVALTVSDVIMATVITDGLASNYNLKVVPAHEAFEGGTGFYLVEVVITPVSGEPIVANFRVEVS